MQKLIIRAVIDKLYTRSYQELKDQAVYQSCKARGYPRRNYYGLLKIFSSNQVIQNLTKIIDVDLRAVFEKRKTVKSLIRTFAPLLPK